MARAGQLPVGLPQAFGSPETKHGRFHGNRTTRVMLERVEQLRFGEMTTRNVIASREATELVDSLLGTLPESAPGLFNPWSSSCVHDSPLNSLQSKRERLALHLDCRAKWVLVGEAPGYQGCRYTGVAFTSEKLLMDGAVPRVGRLPYRLTTRDRAFSEPSATVVWKTLHRLQIADQVVLWNALQLHPFRIDNPWSNRTPRQSEIDLGLAALDMLVKHFKSARVVAVGKKAQALLAHAGVCTFDTVRHPSMGGANEFAAQMTRIASIVRA